MVKGDTFKEHRFLQQQDKNNDKDNNNNKNAPETDPPTDSPTETPTTEEPTQVPTEQPSNSPTDPPIPQSNDGMVYGNGDDGSSPIIVMMGKMSLSFSIWNLELVELFKQARNLEEKLLASTEDAIVAAQLLQKKQHHEKLIALIMESFLCKETGYKIVPLHVYRSGAATTGDVGSTNNAVTREIWNHVIQYTDICAKYRNDDTGNGAAYYDEEDQHQQNAAFGGDGISGSNANGGRLRHRNLRKGTRRAATTSTTTTIAKDNSRSLQQNQYERAKIQKYDVVSENEAFFSESLHEDTSVVESHPIVEVVVSNSSTTVIDQPIIEYTTWTMEYYVWNISQVAIDRVTQHNWNNDPSALASESLNNHHELETLIAKSAIDRLAESTQLAIDWNIRNGNFDEQLHDTYSNDGSLNWEYQVPTQSNNNNNGQKSTSFYALAGIAGEELQAFQSKGVLSTTVVGATYPNGSTLSIDAYMDGDALFIIGVILLCFNTLFVTTLFILGHFRLKAKALERKERETMQAALLESCNSTDQMLEAKNMKDWMKQQQQQQLQQGQRQQVEQQQQHHQQFDNVFKKPNVARSASLASANSSVSSGGVQSDGGEDILQADIEQASSYSSEQSDGMYQIPSHYNVRPSSFSASASTDSRSSGRATPPQMIYGGSARSPSPSQWERK